MTHFIQNRLAELFRERFGSSALSVTELSAHGSNRRMYRLAGPAGTAIGVYGPDEEENRAFLSFSASLRSAGLPVPEIYIADPGAGLYLEEDLGDVTLFDALAAGRQAEEVSEAVTLLYQQVADMLPRVQVEGGRVIDYAVAYPAEEFDRGSMLWDLNYFKYHFAKLAGVPFNERRLEDDFSRLADFLLEADRSHFLYRDFQSRNIMIRDGAPWLIDYQGGRRGALQYDIASLLYDAKAALPQSLRDALFERYLVALETLVEIDRTRFVAHYRGFVLLRILQALGAYGYRGIFQRKPLFLASVPYAIRNIRGLLAEGFPVQLPELQGLLERLGDLDLRALGVPPTPASSSNQAPDVASSRLTLEIRSFSYRRGYPEDDSGHGGGFVFDCRALHNPGRYEPYKGLCGTDGDVIAFLEKEEKVVSFWESVRSIVDDALESYLARGFDRLSVSFGCTGGQHRSVYFAERLASHVREKFPAVDLLLSHREKDRWPATAGRG